MRLGLSPTGGFWLVTRAATGSLSFCPGAASSADRPTMEDCHAPRSSLHKACLESFVKMAYVQGLSDKCQFADVLQPARIGLSDFMEYNVAHSCA